MLRQLLTPDWIPGLTLPQLPLRELLERPLPIRALILDVDRTLLPQRCAFLPPTAESWLREAQRRLPIHLLSNNPSRRRIGAVGKQVGVPFTTAAGKPRRAALRRVLAELALPPAQVALVGDRLFTDVLAGNRLGLFTVLVKPIDPEGRPCQQDRLQNLELRMARWVGSGSGG
jgi:HAD superfamily phosphatase (TIGR01668 family)